MRARLLPPFGMIVSFIVIMLFVSALPPSQAASRSIGPSVGGVNVTGQVFITGTQPAIYTYVSLTPVLPNNVIDYNNSRYMYTDNNGIYTFTDVLAGNYSMDIRPYCISDVLPLIDDRFSVPITTAPINRGPITLPPAMKHISGKVTLNGTTTTQSDVLINAYNHVTSNFACAYTDSAGAYNLGVTGGSWELSISAKPGALWMFTQKKPVVSFADNTLPETQALDLTVQPTDGFLTGRVLDPSGNPLPLPAGVPPSSTTYNYSAAIDIWNDDNGSYNTAYLDATGTFTLPVVSGRYNTSVWVNQYDYPDYTVPPRRTVDVGKTTLNLGDLRLEARGNKRITGYVRDNQVQPIPNAYVQAYESGGRFVSAQTAADGSYDLRIPDGIWNVDIYPPDGSSYLNINASQVISTTQDPIYPLDFVLTQAAAQIYGTLVDQQGQPVTDVDAWAYARTDGPNAWDVVSNSPVINGSFVLNVPDGAMKVGIYLAPNSDYSLVSEMSPAALSRRLAASQSLNTVAMAQLEQSAYEQAVTIPPAGVGAAQVSKSVQLTLARHDATISGTLIDQQTGAAAGVTGVVIASPNTADANWQSVNLNSDGSYALKLAAGTWYLSYSLDGEQYNPYPADPVVVSAISGQVVTQNLITTRLDGVIEGMVVDDAGKPMPHTYIWVRGTDFEQYAVTDEQGAFIVYVPLNDGANPARYSVGTAFACDTLDTCQLDADPQTVVATSRSALGGLLIAPQALTLKAKQKGPVTRIQGIVTNSVGNPLKFAQVNFAPNPGSFASDNTTNEGKYTLNVTFPAGTRSAFYQLDAGYKIGSAFYLSQRRTGILDISSALRAAAAGPSLQSIELPPAQLDETITLPQRVSDIFQASDGWTYTLSDGSQIQIPANTVPITPTSQVQIVVEATPLLQTTSLYSLATHYGYTITLYDASNGKQITGQLRSDALLTLRYDEATLVKRGVSESQIRPASFSDNLWQPSDKHVVTTQSNKVTVQTRTLGVWALVQPQGNAVIHLPVMRR